MPRPSCSIQLTERAEVGVIRRRHAEYYSNLMNEAAPHLLTRDQLTWLKVVEADRDNMLAALHYWCDAQDAGNAIALAMSLSEVAFVLGNHADISELITQAVALPGDADPELRTVADVLHVITLTMGEDDRAKSAAERLPGLADRVETLNCERFPLAGLMRPAYAMFIRDTELAHRYIEENLTSQDEWLVAATWMISAGLAENDGDMDALRSASAQALERFRAIGERWGLSSALRMVASVRLLDGDLDGATDTLAESGRVLAELGARDDLSHMRLQLANIAARRGDTTAAREFFQAALAGAEPGLYAAMVSAGYAMFECAAGNVELARSLTATAEQETALLNKHLARHHLIAMVAASKVMIAIEDADLPLAGEHAATAYREGIASDDMPLLASVAGPLTHLAHALGHPDRAAKMLGACAAVRGGEDQSDLTITRLRPRLRDALGPDAYNRAYAAGTALTRTEALTLLDPATF
jgi:hypothetical protein